MVRAGIDNSIINHLRFVGLASYTLFHQPSKGNING